MIYIVKKTKKAKKHTSYDFMAARNLIEIVDRKALRRAEYVILGGDTKEELDALVNFFSQDYLVPLDDGENIATAWRLNAETPICERRSADGASLSSLTNFVDKITKKYAAHTINVFYFKERFEVFITTKEYSVKLHCTYKLEIKKVLVFSSKKQDLDIASPNRMVKEINEMFRRQRYYYRRKERENVKD